MAIFDGNFNIKEDLGFTDDVKIDGVITPNTGRGFEPDDNAYFDMQLAQALGGLGNNSMFANYTSPIKAYETPTYNPAQAMVNASPITKLIKALFGVDQFTGSFEEGRSNDQQQQAMTPVPMPAPNPVPPPVLTPTEPQPSPNPDGLFIRPNMLNQVPDSYSQAFKDANQAYMQNVALRPSDFREKIDLRGFEKLKGLLGE